jgi:hypothetical protein
MIECNRLRLTSSITLTQACCHGQDKGKKEAVIASLIKKNKHTWDVKTEVRPLIDATFLSFVDCLDGFEGGVVLHV